jgi:hypothetical protein
MRGTASNGFPRNNSDSAFNSSSKSKKGNLLPEIAGQPGRPGSQGDSWNARPNSRTERSRTGDSWNTQSKLLDEEPKVTKPKKRETIKVVRTFDVGDEMTAQQHPERLTDSQVKDIFRKATRGTMESLSEAPVLVDIWGIAGYPYGVNASWLEELTREVCPGSFVELQGFVSIWTGYADRWEATQRAAFIKAGDGSKTLTDSQLPTMFHALQFWPMPGALLEAKQIVVGRERCGQGVNLVDFQRMYVELYSRAGLTRSEFKHAEAIFKQHAGGGPLLKTNALRAALASVESHFMLTRFDPVVLEDFLIDGLVNEVISQVTNRELTLDFGRWSQVLEITEGMTLIDGAVSFSAFIAACNVAPLCGRPYRKRCRALEHASAEPIQAC